MSAPTVFVVDDDPSIRDALALLLSLHGLNTQMFASGEAFLSACRDSWSGCLLLDLKLGGMSGVEVHAELVRRKSRLKTVMLTGHGDVATARAVLKSGAADFLEKPVDNDVLLDVIRTALGGLPQEPPASPAEQWRQQVAKLTPREREVMELLVLGKQNREIGLALQISPRTVEVYRARMMEKLRVPNLAELIRAHLNAAAEAPR